MTALAHFRTAIDRHGPTEIDATYQEAIREYRSNIRESWLRQEIARIERRLKQIHCMKIFHKENNWSMAVLKRQSFKEVSALEEHRKELRRLLP